MENSKVCVSERCIQNTQQNRWNDERVVEPREDIDHDALWLALLNEVRQSGAHARSVRVTGCDGIH